MTPEEKAKYLDDVFTGLLENQTRIAADIEGLFAELDAEIEPIKRVMKKYSVFFQNPNFPGKTTLGVVLGITIKHPQRLLVLIDKLVCPVDATNDKADVLNAMTLSEFVRMADLHMAKAGFDYVKKIGSPEANPIAERNRDMAAFFEECKKESTSQT